MNTGTRMGLIAAGAGTALALLVAPSAMAAPTTVDGHNPTSSNQQLQWVRGTAVHITNNTGETVHLGTQTNTGSLAPVVNKTPLASGETRQTAQPWDSTDTTSVFAEVQFNDGTAAQFSVENPGIGTPTVAIRDGKWGTIQWQYAPYDSQSFGQGQSWTKNLDGGHSMTFKRVSDDSRGHGNSKVWDITLNK